MKNKIKGFEWYLPMAYRDSVAQCKFEQGDVIYKQALQDKNWAEQTPNITYLIQVKSPNRTIAGTKEDLDIFESNWETKIVFEIIYPNDPGLNRVVESTQGRFFTFLWKNDESVFNESTQILPALTSGRLRPVKPKLRNNNLVSDDLKTIGWINVEFISSVVPIGFSGLALIVDSVNNLMTNKRNVVVDILREDPSYSFKIFECEKAITLDPKQEKPALGFTPTLTVELFLIHTTEVGKIMEKLKKVLFKQKKERGMFSISNHALLVEN